MRNMAWAVNVVAQAMLFVAALRARCWPRFAWWLGTSLASGALLSRFDPGGQEYLTIYAACEPLLAALLTGALLEVLAERDRRWVHGLGPGVRWLLIAAAVVSVVLVLIASQPAWRSEQLVWLWRGRRWFTAAFAVSAAASLAILSVMYVPTPRAVIVQHRFLAAYALLQAAGMVAAGYRTATVNAAVLATGAVLYTWWAIAIRAVEAMPAPQEGPLARQTRRHRAGLGVIRRLVREKR